MQHSSPNLTCLKCGLTRSAEFFNAVLPYCDECESSPNMQTISEILRRENMTQSDLASRLGKSLRTIQRWQADEVKLDLNAVIKAL